MAGGFYNHYDDPDEFWDEEPLRPVSKPSRPSSSHDALAGSTPDRVGTPAPYEAPPVARPVPPTEPRREPAAPAAAQAGNALTARDARPTFSDPHLGELIGELDSIRHVAESTAAEYEWIDGVARSLHRRGQDRSGSVHTTLDEHNIPTRFTISRDWKTRLPGIGLDTAVMEAVTFAFADGWRRASIEVGAARARGESPPPPVAPATPAETAPPQYNLEDLIEEVLSLAAKPTAELLRTTAVTPPETGRKVRFEFSKYGMSSCRIDKQWASTTATSQIETEVNNQLALQREGYRAGQSARQSPEPFTGATAKLIDMLRNSGTQGWR